MNSQKQKKHSGVKKAFSVAAMGAVCLSAALSVAVFSRTITVTDGSQTVTIDTMNPSTDGAVKDSQLLLGEDDRLVRTGDVISIMRDYSQPEESMILAEGGSRALAEAETSDMEIRIENWVSIELDLRGKKTKKDVPAGTVGDALAYLNIKLGKGDVLNQNQNVAVSDGMKLIITRTTYKTVTKTESIHYETVYTDTSALYEGATKVDTEGEKGERELTVKEKYVNGKKVSEEVLSGKVTKKPVTEVILIGTAVRTPEPLLAESIERSGSSTTVDEDTNVIIDSHGNVLHYSYSLYGPTTAYTADYGASTATGRLARYGVVAVDPSEIPYGSILYIISDDGFEYGFAVAGDTGGFIYFTDVVADLYFPTFDDCSVYGLRNAHVYVLEGMSEDVTYH